MTIQITLHANEFKRNGSHEGYEYTSLCVKSFSNSRIYFFAINNGMRMVTVAKQMKCEDGKVFVSFGKNDKLIIGSYTDDSVVTNEIIEDVTDSIIDTLIPAHERLLNDKRITNIEFLELLNQYDINISYSLEKWCIDKLDEVGLGQYSYRGLGKGTFPKELSNIMDDLYDAIVNKLNEIIEETEQTKEDNKYNYTPVDTFIRDNYSIQLLTGKDYQNKPIWKLIYTNIETGSINEELSDIIYLSLEAAMRDINSIPNPVTPDKQSPIKTKQLKETKEVIPQLNMTASYAKLIYTGDKVDVTFSNDHESNTITFKRKKSWSHRKYVDKIINESDIKLTYDFRYGWEIISA